MKPAKNHVARDTGGYLAAKTFHLGCQRGKCGTRVGQSGAAAEAKSKVNKTKTLKEPS